MNIQGTESVSWLRLVQMYRISLGCFLRMQKCTLIENSLSYCILRRSERALRPVQTERVIRSRIGRFNTRIKCGQLDNYLSYCVLRSQLRRSERVFKVD